MSNCLSSFIENKIFFLVIGFILSVFSIGRYNIPIAIYIWPFCFLTFLHNNNTKLWPLIVVSICIVISNIFRWISISHTNILADIDSAVATQAEYDRVEANLTKLSNSVDELETQFIEIIESYNDKNITNNAVKVNDTSYVNVTSVFSLRFIVEALKLTFPIVGLTIVGICIYYLIREIRKNKKKEVIEEAVTA